VGRIVQCQALRQHSFTASSRSSGVYVFARFINSPVGEVYQTGVSEKVSVPHPASSGKTVQHRLNRGGDRQANNALWTIAMVRMRSEPRTRAYVARRSAEGMSNKEIHRCLKRYIVRELYPLIMADLASVAEVS
jgi:hypothetical protein